MLATKPNTGQNNEMSNKGDVAKIHKKCSVNETKTVPKRSTQQKYCVDDSVITMKSIAVQNNRSSTEV